MNTKLPTVKNPMTIVALFAGIAELAGTVVLPFVAGDNQSLYIWYVMLFPVLLVALFFLTLNFNPNVLYAPSDFKDEQNYMDLFRPPSATEKVRDVEEKLLHDQPTNLASGSKSDAPHDADGVMRVSDGPTKHIINHLLSDVPGGFKLIEDLVVEKLTTEFHVKPRREVALVNAPRSPILDAVFEAEEGLIIVEVSFVKEGSYTNDKMRRDLDRFNRSYFALPERVRGNSKFLLVVVFDLPKDESVRLNREFETMSSSHPMSVDLRLYSLQELLA